MRALAAVARWQETSEPADDGRRLPAVLTGLAAAGHQRARSAAPALRRRNRSRRAYSPALPVARFDRPVLRGGTISKTTRSRCGLTPRASIRDRAAIAEMLRMPVEKVRCIHHEGSGCYGHNGADDAAGDAALLARRCRAGRCGCNGCANRNMPWSRYGPAMVVKVKAGLDERGKIAAWDYDDLEQHPFDAAGAGRRAASRRAISRNAVSRAGAEAHSDAGRRR